MALRAGFFAVVPGRYPKMWQRREVLWDNSLSLGDE